MYGILRLVQTHSAVARWSYRIR